ncbi:MAG TPA: DUF488 domain-containing protein [Phycisphaerae bacterium]|nr:DUF488 domain-containing protein [Phycisphaerae bacterium]
MRIRIKRVYEDPSRADGYRVLVDRLWPRGLRKEDARLNEWAKDLAPSDELRKWFGHEAGKWDEFRRRYRRELAGKGDDVAALVHRCPKRTITLLFAARDTDRNNAVVLKEVLETRLPE